LSIELITSGCGGGVESSDDVLSVPLKDLNLSNISSIVLDLLLEISNLSG